MPLEDKGGAIWGRIWGNAQIGRAKEDTLALHVGDACVTWRSETAVLRFVRAPAGRHTIYYCVENGAAYFATKLPRLFSLLPGKQQEFHEGSLADFVACARVLPPLTIFTGVRHLVPGTSLAWSGANSGALKCTAHQDWDWDAAWALSRSLRSKNIRETMLSGLFGPIAQEATMAGAPLAHPFSLDIFNELPSCTSILVDPIGEYGIALFAHILKHVKLPSVLNCDVTDDLLQDLHLTGTPSRRVGGSFMLKPRWRKQFENHWLEERMRELISPIASVLARIPQWEPEAVIRLLYVAPERRLQLTALAEAHGKMVNFPGSAPVDMLRILRDGPDHKSAAHASLFTVCGRGFSVTEPESGNLFTNTVRQFHRSERLGRHTLAHYFALSPFAMNRYLKHPDPGFRFDLEERLAGLMSLQYIWRFAARLPSAHFDLSGKLKPSMHAANLSTGVSRERSNDCPYSS